MPYIIYIVGKFSLVFVKTSREVNFVLGLNSRFLNYRIITLGGVLNGYVKGGLY